MRKNSKPLPALGAQLSDLKRLRQHAAQQQAEREQVRPLLVRSPAVQRRRSHPQDISAKAVQPQHDPRPTGDTATNRTAPNEAPNTPNAAPEESAHSFAQLIQQTSEAHSAASLQPNDQQLFRQQMRHVQPLKRSGRQGFDTIPLAQELAQSRQQHATGQVLTPALEFVSSDQYYALGFDEDTTEYLSPACGTDVLKNLQRGRWEIRSHLDLHGATLDEARLLVANFIAESLEYDVKCVRIVHGIGYGSRSDGPVLLPTVRRWLGQMHAVLAFTECEPHEGGKGAVKILLRRQRS